MTHAQQEEILLDYFTKYRATINLVQFADAAEVPRSSVRYFLSGERGMTPDVLAKVQKYLKQLATDLQAFQ